MAKLMKVDAFDQPAVEKVKIFNKKVFDLKILPKKFQIDHKLYFRQYLNIFVNYH